MFKIDWWLFIYALGCSLLGILIIFSINPNLAKNQLIYVLLSLVFFSLFSFLDFEIFKRTAWIFYLLAIVILLVNIVFGQITRGSVRWLSFGFFTVQASELVKPLLIIFFSAYSSKTNLTKIKNLLIFSSLFILPFLLVFKQPDLGSSMVVAIIFLVIILFSNIKKSHLILGLIILIGALPLGYGLLKDYQKERLTTFLNPKKDPLGSGYQILQSLITVGSGELLGRGLGRGTQSQLQFLPERHTDFIFASYAESTGFIGSSLLLVCYLLLFLRILAICQKTPDRYTQLASVAVLAMFLFQFFVNLGMNLGLMPITGITLPFFSYGGNSMISCWICLGLLSNISQHLLRNKLIEIK